MTCARAVNNCAQAMEVSLCDSESDFSTLAYNPNTNTTAAIDTNNDMMDMAVNKRINTLFLAEVGSF